MRIIAGEWKSRRLAMLKGNAIRPTPDRVREAWMSMIAPDLPGATVLDLFAGTGALGLEALSRGAVHVDFVENDARSLAVLEANISALGAGTRCHVHRADAVRFAQGVSAEAYHVAFADPPYRRGLALELASVWLTVPFSTIFGVEHEAAVVVSELGDLRRYGDTAITLFGSKRT